MKSNLFYAAAFAVLTTFTASAQDKEKRFGFELSGGASFATARLNGAELNTGLGFEGIFHYRFLPFTGVYAGWGWNRLGAHESFAGADVCFEETGYVLGLQFRHPMGDSPVSYYLRAGALYNHIETENAQGDIIYDTGHGWGWQLAGGLDLPLGKNWSLTPGLKYNSLSRDLDLEGAVHQLDHRYLSVRLGILKRF